MDSTTAVSLRLLGRFAFCAAVVFLASGGTCYMDPHGLTSPPPETLEHHHHTVTIYPHVINSDRDTIGIRSVSSSFAYLSSEREAGGNPTRTYANMGGSAGAISLVNDSTPAQQCSASIAHYVTYQSRYDGDSTRYAQLDGCGTWTLSIGFGIPAVVTDDGETTQIRDFHVACVPDTVRQNGLLELDVTSDLDGLVTRDSSGSGFGLNPDHIRITQR